MILIIQNFYIYALACLLEFVSAPIVSTCDTLTVVHGPTQREGQALDVLSWGWIGNTLLLSYLVFHCVLFMVFLMLCFMPFVGDFIA